MVINSILIIFAYLLGSISSAVVVCKLCGLADPRKQGSHNPGTTNVLRIGGKKAAIMTLLGDSLKGFIPVFIAGLLSVKTLPLSLIALAAFLGHLFPIFFGFKGGKGVATYLGILFGLSWLLGLLAVTTWLIVAILFRYSSLAALLMTLAMPFYSALLGGLNLIPLLAVLGIILVLRHHQNIRRLLGGDEGKIGG